jgi:hypothetical protein
MVNLRYAPRKKREDGWQKFGPRDDEMSGMRGPYDISLDERTQDEPTQKKKSFMEGGDFGWRDGLGMALAGIGDAFTREGGGEGGALNSMLGRAYSARDMAKKAQAKALEDAAAREESARRMTAARPDLTPAQIEAVSYGDFTPDQAMPRQPDVPAFVKNLDAWNQMTPEKRQEVAAMQAILNPTFGQGADGIRRPDAPVMGTPVGTIEDGYQFMGGDERDERSWKKVGGAGPAAPRPFRR